MDFALQGFVAFPPCQPRPLFGRGSVRRCHVQDRFWGVVGKSIVSLERYFQGGATGGACAQRTRKVLNPVLCRNNKAGSNTPASIPTGGGIKQGTPGENKSDKTRRKRGELRPRIGGGEPGRKVLHNGKLCGSAGFPLWAGLIQAGCFLGWMSLSRHSYRR